MPRRNPYLSGQMGSTPTRGREEDQRDPNQQDMGTGRGKEGCRTSDRSGSTMLTYQKYSDNVNAAALTLMGSKVVNSESSNVCITDVLDNTYRD